MAKRKRLTPAVFSGDADIPEGLETKSMPPIAGIAREAAQTAALSELSDTLRAAREKGRMVLDLPLEQIQLDHLVRDRVALDPADLAALSDSLRARGQQTPIEVVALGPDRYGLISGWRRCQALAQLAQETGAPASVLALLRSPQDASEAYQAMVEENEIRVGLSYYERARIALKAVEEGVFDSDKSALQSLFRSASKAKRSKIGSFVTIVRALDGHLRFPAALGERAGLALSRALEDHPTLAQSLCNALEAQVPDTAEAERSCLEAGMTKAAKAPRAPAGPSVTSPVAQRPQDPAPQAARVPKRQAMTATLWMTTNPDGTVTLGGPGVSPVFCEKLRRWMTGGK